MTVTCGKCGHTAEIEEWQNAKISGQLPAGMFQCPECGFAFERKSGPPTVYPDGFVIPGKVTLVPVQARF
jgi:hypothetical protein